MTEILPPESKAEHHLRVSQKGFELSFPYMDESMSALQQVMGEKFVVGQNGLQIAQGDVPSVSEFLVASNTLLGVHERGDDLQSMVGWALGDLMVLAEKMYGDEVEDILAQVLPETGNTKHTITQSIRVSKGFPSDKRIPGLSKTHHQEILNYRDSIRETDLERILQEVFSEGRKSQIINSEGIILRERVKPLSCAELRKKLRRAAGLSEKDEKQEDHPGYLYCDEEGELYHHHTFSKKAYRAFTIYDLKTMSELDSDGNPQAISKISQLSQEWL